MDRSKCKVTENVVQTIHEMFMALPKLYTVTLIVCWKIRNNNEKQKFCNAVNFFTFTSIIKKSEINK